MKTSQRIGLAGSLVLAPLLGCNTTPEGMAAAETVFYQVTGAAAAGAFDPKTNTVNIDTNGNGNLSPYERGVKKPKVHWIPHVGGVYVSDSRHPLHDWYYGKE